MQSHRGGDDVITNQIGSGCSYPEPGVNHGFPQYQRYNAIDSRGYDSFIA
jgi:hypothetical protein